MNELMTRSTVGVASIIIVEGVGVVVDDLLLDGLRCRDTIATVSALREAFLDRQTVHARRGTAV